MSRKNKHEKNSRIRKRYAVLKQRRQIQDQYAEKRQNRVQIKFFLTLFLSVWIIILSLALVYHVVIPLYGEETKGVLTNKVTVNSYGIKYYYGCAYTINGKSYNTNSKIPWEEPPLQLGDTVKIIYLKVFPTIFRVVKEKK